MTGGWLPVVTMFFFFFQAEDGIRDLTVTGVQTCALPIYHVNGAARRDVSHDSADLAPQLNLGAQWKRRLFGEYRSEERRVGKGVDLGGRRIIKKKKTKHEGM